MQITRREFFIVGGLSGLALAIPPLWRNLTAQSVTGSPWAFDGQGLVFPAYFDLEPRVIDPTPTATPTASMTPTASATPIPTPTSTPTATPSPVPEWRLYLPFLRRN